MSFLQNTGLCFKIYSSSAACREVPELKSTLDQKNGYPDTMPNVQELAKVIAFPGKDIEGFPIFCRFLEAVLSRMCNFWQHCIIFQCYFPHVRDTTLSTDKDPFFLY